MKRTREIICVLGLAVGLAFLTHCAKQEAPPTASNTPPAAPAVENTAAVAGDAAVTAPGEAPDIEFEELIHDFGKVDQGDMIEHVFKFKNTGKGELIIERVKSS